MTLFQIYGNPKSLQNMFRLTVALMKGNMVVLMKGNTVVLMKGMFSPFPNHSEQFRPHVDNVDIFEFLNSEIFSSY
jgi:hypothetical protein